MKALLSSEMPCYVGIDAGSRAVKIVIADHMGNVLIQGKTDQGIHQETVAMTLLDQLLSAISLSRNNIQKVVSTGYARHLIVAADQKVTEITCHARGVAHLFPTAQSIIEIGGQDSKFIRLSPGGKVRDFVMNDRCAAGTGCFLEMVMKRLELSLENMEELVHEEEAQRNPSVISSMCVVFAETEIIGLLASGVPPGQILTGVQFAVAQRVIAMSGRSLPDTPVVFTGGGAVIPGMKHAFEKILQTPLFTPEFPQMTGALGAALTACR